MHFIFYFILYIEIFKIGKKFFSKKYWKYAILFNLPLIPHYLTSIVLNQCDRIMIDKMIGTASAGIYGFAYSIGIIAIFIVDSISHSYTPWMYKNIKNNNVVDIKKYTNIIGMFIALGCLVIIFVTPEIVKILGTSDYYDSIWIIPPIAISIYFRFLYGIYSNIEFYFEKKYFISVASIIIALINIITNYYFIKNYGYIAAAYTTLFCFILYSISHAIFSIIICKKEIGKGVFNYLILFLIGLILIIVGGLIMLLYNYWYIRYSILITVFLILLLKHKDIISIYNKIKEQEIKNEEENKVKNEN